MPVMDEEFDSFRPDYRRVARVRFNAIGEAWQLYQQRWVVWSLSVLVVIVGYAIINGGLAAILGVPHPNNPGGFRAILRLPTTFIQASLFSMVGGVFLGAMSRSACRQVRGVAIDVDTLFSISDVFVNLVIGAILIGLAWSVGFFFFVLPGLVIAGLLMFTIPLIVDAGLPPREAISLSWQALKGEWFTATLFHLAVWFLASLGGALCCVGIVITAPLYSLSIAVLYRDFFLAKGPRSSDKPASFADDF